ncbi:MAG: hypothetical protein NWE79_06260 [Candidatus Bathyarchaeota archaeon]|nr:hypothetical protein [Candidatus Bathyarchaeota archaeon]
MAPLPITDLLIGIGALAVAAFAIYLFIRASGGWSRTGQTEPEAKTVDEEAAPPQPIPPAQRGSGLQLPRVERHLRQPDVELARSSLRTLTLQRELLSMVLKRLFEAEDEGEITREERLRLSRGYEAEMKSLSEELKRTELMVALNELESIRDDILKKFEATLNQTQSRIDAIIKELKLEEPRKAPARAPRRKKPEEKEEVEEEAEEEKPEPPRRRRSEVEEKVEQLRREVLKELEELEKLEIEV